MRGRRIIWLSLTTLAAVALVAAACGDDGEEAEATPTTAPPAATSPTVEASPSDAATPQTAPQVIEISAIAPLKFDQDTIVVEAGSQVTLRFINDESGVPHNWAAYTDESAAELIPGAITDVCSGPCEEEITFTAPTQPGEYFFRCDVHPVAMTGTLDVR